MQYKRHQSHGTVVYNAQIELNQTLPTLPGFEKGMLNTLQ